MAYPETALHHRNHSYGSPYDTVNCEQCGDAGCMWCDMSIDGTEADRAHYRERNEDLEDKCGACLGEKVVHPGIECEDCDGTGEWNLAAEARVQARRDADDLEPIPFS